MGNIVDYVLNVMRDISTTTPVLFQRDGSLYIASEQGFGQITNGLRTTPEEIQEWENRQQAPEILESEDAITQRTSEETLYKKKEKSYLQAVCFGPDHTTFSLEDMAKAARTLGNLPDDGEIRMVDHHSSYHSHKYGYAADGIDVWVTNARVMDKERYLELLKKREDERLAKMEQAIASYNERDRHERYEFYKQHDFTFGTIITPHLLVTLPLNGYLDYYRERPDSWTPETRLQTTHDNYSQGGMLRHFEPDIYKETPFSIAVKLNTHTIKGTDARSIEQGSQGLLERIAKELAAVQKHLPLAEAHVAKMNAMHQRVFAENIEWSKELRKEKKTKKTTA